MISSIDGGCLPDVNVRIALVSDRHEHHAIARSWFDSVVGPVLFCRVTQMAFFRLLTNGKVMGEDRLSPAGALFTYSHLVTDQRVHFASEPYEIENTWTALMSAPLASGSAWTDAYLVAFSSAAGVRLVTFDRGMRRWPSGDLEILKPS